LWPILGQGQLGLSFGQFLIIESKHKLSGCAHAVLIAVTNWVRVALMIRAVMVTGDGVSVAPLAQCFAVSNVDALRLDEAERVAILFQIRDTLGGADIAEL